MKTQNQIAAGRQYCGVEVSVITHLITRFCEMQIKGKRWHPDRRDQRASDVPPPVFTVINRAEFRQPGRQATRLCGDPKQYGWRDGPVALIP